MMNWRGKCSHCHKRNYADEIAAKFAIAIANAEYNGAKGDNKEVLPKRAYKCPVGKYYHLTHTEERSYNVR